MQGSHKPFDYFRTPRVFAFVFADLTRFVVKIPRFGDLNRNQLDDNIHRLYTGEIVREMRTDAK